jgi:anti-anti-sigma factor
MDDSPRFGLDVRDGDQGPIVVLAGDIDLSTVNEIGACLVPLAGQRVRLDFGAVTFMDSTGIRVLIEAQHRAETDGGELVLCRVQPAQMRVLEITGLAHRFEFDGTTPSG